MKDYNTTIDTYKGLKVNPFNSKSSIDIDIEDIAHSLSLLCRFNGHCAEFYSIAQHSILVSEIVSAENALWGLLHDATESYLSDLPSPIKNHPRLLFYKQTEKMLSKTIFEKFELIGECPKEIKDADYIALVTEKRDLMNAEEKWPLEDFFKPLNSRIVPMNPAEAKEAFLNRYYELCKNR